MTQHAINVNDTVKVRLTARGREVVEAYWKDALYYSPLFKAPYTPRDWRETDAEGYSTVQLWDVMHTLGPEMRLGAQPVIEGNLVVIDTAAP